MWNSTGKGSSSAISRRFRELPRADLEENAPLEGRDDFGLSFIRQAARKAVTATVLGQGLTMRLADDHLLQWQLPRAAGRSKGLEGVLIAAAADIGGPKARISASAGT